MSLTKGTKAEPVQGGKILSVNGRLVVLETAALVKTTEMMERYLPRNCMLLSYTVTDLSLLCGRIKLSPGRATKEVMVRALLSELRAVAQEGRCDNFASGARWNPCDCLQETSST